MDKTNKPITIPTIDMLEKILDSLLKVEQKLFTNVIMDYFENNKTEVSNTKSLFTILSLCEQFKEYNLFRNNELKKYIEARHEKK